MNFEILIVLSLIVLAFSLFVTEKFPLDVTALLILSILLIVLPHHLSPEEAISGFANPAVITIGLLFVLSFALQKTRLFE